VARLGTVGPSGTVRMVPCCFALDGGRVVSAVDQKPKTTIALARLADITRTGRATLLIDHYDEDWSALWWVRVAGSAVVHARDDPLVARALAALGAKYAQYRTAPPPGPVLSVALDTVTSWRAR
jgi:PPOX class probable F420-dependent enzyme